MKPRTSCFENVSVSVCTIERERWGRKEARKRVMASDPSVSREKRAHSTSGRDTHA